MYKVSICSSSNILKFSTEKELWVFGLQVSRKNVWKEIYQQLLIGNAEDEVNDCPEKIMFGTIFKAIQVFKKSCFFILFFLYFKLCQNYFI